MKRTESYIDRTRYENGESFKVKERCDILRELTGEDLFELYRERLTVEVDSEIKIDLGFHQAAWSDESWDAYGFAVSIDWDGINTFSVDRKNVIDGTSIESVRKRVINEKLNETLNERGESGWGKLRWSGGASVEDVIMKTNWKGLVIVRGTTMLAD